MPDSVPNLEIEGDDVRWQSRLDGGPVDEDQLYYLEFARRGTGPGERLIVAGFFADIVAKAPVPLSVRCSARGRGPAGGTLDEVVRRRPGRTTMGEQVTLVPQLGPEVGEGPRF